MKCKTPTCHRQRSQRAKHGYCELHAKYHRVTNSFVSSRYSTALVQHLHQQGVPLDTISAGAHIDRRTITRLNRGEQTKVRQSVQRKLVTYAANLNIDEVRVHPVWPTARRLQALQAAGWRQTELAHQLGTVQTVIYDYTHGKKCGVTPAFAKKVNELYREHETDPVRTPTHAAKKAGWVTPMWWDDVDNPNEQPGVSHCRRCHSTTVRHNGLCRSCMIHGYNQRARQKQKERKTA